MSGQDPIILGTVRDIRTLACPLCDFTIDVPDVPVSDALGSVFGMSGRTLAMVHAEQEAKRVSAQMRTHLSGHPVEEWLAALIEASGHRLDIG